MNKSIQVASAITVGLYSTYYTLSYIKEDCERQQIKQKNQQQRQNLQKIMAKNQEILYSVVKHAEKLNVK